MFEGDFSDWLPSVPLTILYCLFVIAAFENQRWAKARARGLKGSSEPFGAFVDFTYYFVSTIFRYGFLVALAVLFDWRQAIGLLAVSFVVAILYSIISTAVIRGRKHSALDGGNSRSLDIGAFSSVSAIQLTFRVTWR